MERRDLIFSNKREFNAEAVGDPLAFEAKIASLKKKWNVPKDSAAIRTAGSLINLNLYAAESSKLAVLADNLNFFRQEWERVRNSNEWYKYLEWACLFGSKEIGEFIISQMEKFLEAKDHDNIFDYILMSDNRAWALSFAERMHDKNMKLPHGIYLYCKDDDFIDRIEQIFNPSPNPTPSADARSRLT